MAQRVLRVIIFLSGVLLSLPAFGQRTVFRTHEPRVVAPEPAATPPIDPGRLADRIHVLVNEERTRRGLEPVEHLATLARIAERHSEDMATRNYFDHVNLKGQDATERAQAGGFLCVTTMQNPAPASIGENLFAGFRYSSYTVSYYAGKVVTDFSWKTEDELAEEAVNAWMESPPHRRNLLHPGYHGEGIGIHVASSLEVFVTQDLC